MAQHSLYRRYRPQRFGEIRGQDHVVRALRNAVATGTEGHAYLFSGPRGTGKTSTARILAKALNCDNLTDGEPCGECEPCLAIEAGRSFDLFELDAASNNGVDAVRDLVERSVVSSPGRTKVYILDEVHMLTAAASNALLKTLEEPPGHVRFVLATTDPQKVLPTIRSRTQHYEFQLLSAAELEDHVRWIVADADLDVDDEAIAHVVRQGRGSARDTLSALDQVVAAGGVLVRSEPVEQLLSALAGNDSGAAMVAVAEALVAGHDPRVLGEALLSTVRDAFLVSLGVDTPHMVDADRQMAQRWADELGTAGLTRAMERIGQALVDMRSAADPRVPLEVSLVQLTAGPVLDAAPAAAAPPGSASAAAASAGTAGAGLADVVSRLERLESQVASGSPNPAGAVAPAPAAEPGGGSDEGPAAGPAGGDRARQALGALSRRADEGSTTAPPPGPAQRGPGRAAPPPPPRRRGGDPPPAARSDRAERTSPPARAAPRSATTAAPVTAAVEDSSGRGLVGAPDRDALVLAFGDVVVPQLRGLAKAILSAGRFVAVAEGVAVFALDNAPTRDRAEQFRGDVERMLGEHFGAAVSLRFIVEADAANYQQQVPADMPAAAPAPTAPAPAAPTPTTPQPPGTPAGAEGDEEAELVIDVDELEDADVAASSVDRLTAAFPGAELIESDDGGQR